MLLVSTVGFPNLPVALTEYFRVGALWARGLANTPWSNFGTPWTIPYYATPYVVVALTVLALYSRTQPGNQRRVAVFLSDLPSRRGARRSAYLLRFSGLLLPSRHARATLARPRARPDPVQRAREIRCHPDDRPTSDARELVLTRHTVPETELRLLLDKLRPERPAPPPPQITERVRPQSLL